MTAVWVENPYAGQGPVLLDVGAGSAALVITCPEELVGSEIGVRRLDEPHSEVLTIRRSIRMARPATRRMSPYCADPCPRGGWLPQRSSRTFGRGATDCGSCRPVRRGPSTSSRDR